MLRTPSASSSDVQLDDSDASSGGLPGAAPAAVAVLLPSDNDEEGDAPWVGQRRTGFARCTSIDLTLDSPVGRPLRAAAAAVGAAGAATVVPGVRSGPSPHPSPPWTTVSGAHAATTGGGGSEGGGGGGSRPLLPARPATGTARPAGWPGAATTGPHTTTARRPTYSSDSDGCTFTGAGAEDEGEEGEGDSGYVEGVVAATNLRGAPGVRELAGGGGPWQPAVPPCATALFKWSW